MVCPSLQRDVSVNMQALASKVFVKVNEDGEVEGQDPAAEAGEGGPKAFFRPLASAASKTNQGRRSNRRRASTLGSNAQMHTSNALAGCLTSALLGIRFHRACELQQQSQRFKCGPEAGSGTSGGG
ncbi:hypothetical protein CEUSTIGMA_g8539.t1 [Chlamydomonas eustigma]|uniref:Uncharacterized protein n=1 Tax=Chlamydomonas eustigma TaxID=1157962 RepID=A0A250XDE5_9CHLO|nr:hypothetical protein CEUSTIGMA_g8539.t1 [Chlamydomonas eustigma]|eukprot:GAX81105.1 hypothetical protein CEUSTIGMA_g8539.t1 [Chlamydomonas eustigma]